MTLTSIRIKAIECRKQGQSYSQIKKDLGVSKSTLSLWLRDYPLTSKQQLALVNNKDIRIEKYRETRKRNREDRRLNIYKSEQKLLLPLSKREQYIAGLMLYWGEGGKTAPTQITLSNTDPKIISYYLNWLVNSLDISRDKVVIRLSLYSNMDVQKETEYWSKLLDLPQTQFRKPYIKKSNSQRITYNTRGHGTCNIIIYGRIYYEKVMMGIQAIAGKYESLG